MKLSKKNKVLLVGIALSLVIVYKLAISKTIDYYNEYNTLNEKFSDRQTNEKNQKLLLSKNKELDQILNKLNYNSKNKNQQNNLLKLIDDKASENSLKIIAFEEPKYFIEDKSKTIHYRFSLEGNFNKTLLLLNHLENNSNIGSIKHFHTIKKTNYKLNSDYLITDVLIEKKEYLE